MYIMNYIERLAYVEVVNNPKTNYNRPCCFQLAEMNKLPKLLFGKKKKKKKGGGVTRNFGY